MVSGQHAGETLESGSFWKKAGKFIGWIAGLIWSLICWICRGFKKKPSDESVVEDQVQPTKPEQDKSSRLQKVYAAFGILRMDVEDKAVRDNFRLFLQCITAVALLACLLISVNSLASVGQFLLWVAVLVLLVVAISCASAFLVLREKQKATEKALFDLQRDMSHPDTLERLFEDKILLLGSRDGQVFTDRMIQMARQDLALEGFAQAGNLGALRALVSVNHFLPEHFQMSWFAAAPGQHIDVLRYLVDEKLVDKNVSDGDGDNLAHVAVKLNLSDLIQFAEEIGVDFNALNGEGKSAYQCQHEDSRVVSDVLRRVAEGSAEPAAEEPASGDDALITGEPAPEQDPAEVLADHVVGDQTEEPAAEEAEADGSEFKPVEGVEVVEGEPIDIGDPKDDELHYAGGDDEAAPVEEAADGEVEAVDESPEEAAAQEIGADVAPEPVAVTAQPIADAITGDDEAAPAEDAAPESDGEAVDESAEAVDE